MNDPICGWCCDGLCAGDGSDCTFRNLPIPCACPCQTTSNAHPRHERTPRMTTEPQDHLPKKGGPFTFEADGKTHTLPNVEVGRNALSGRDLRDAAVGGEIGQLGYLFKTLEKCNPDKAALSALLDLPQAKTMEILAKWGEHGDGDGASLGE